MKKVLWFSRHDMSDAQLADLKRIFGEVEISKCDKTVSNVAEIKDEIAGADILAIVAPINLQEQFLKVSNGKPVISSRNKRILTPAVDGVSESKVHFEFDGWFKIVKIEVVTEDL